VVATPVGGDHRDETTTDLIRERLFGD